MRVCLFTLFWGVATGYLMLCNTDVWRVVLTSTFYVVLWARQGGPAPWPRFTAVTARCDIVSAGTNGVWPGDDIPHAPICLIEFAWRTRRVARRDTMQSRALVINYGYRFGRKLKQPPGGCKACPSGCLHTFNSKVNLSPRVLRPRRALFVTELAQTFTPLQDS